MEAFPAVRLEPLIPLLVLGLDVANGIRAEVECDAWSFPLGPKQHCRDLGDPAAWTPLPVSPPCVSVGAQPGRPGSSPSAAPASFPVAVWHSPSVTRGFSFSLSNIRSSFFVSENVRWFFSFVCTEHAGEP